MQAVADLARELAPKTETARALAPELVEAIREQGLFRLGVPRTLGGAELALGRDAGRRRVHRPR